MRTNKQLERIIKGFANHRRIEILLFLEEHPESSLVEITERLEINFRTSSEHVRKLSLANLIMKRYEGNFVRHALTPTGRSALKFLRTLE